MPGSHHSSKLALVQGGELKSVTMVHKSLIESDFYLEDKSGPRLLDSR